MRILGITFEKNRMRQGQVMAWLSWKPKDRRRPPGQWRQFQMATAVVGITHRAAAVMAFVKGASASERRGDDWGIDLERQPTNPHHGNAIAVCGCWTERRKRWFRSEAIEPRRAHIGYINRSMADQLAEAGSAFPLAAELYEVRVNDSNDDPELLGAIIKIIVLIPSKMDPAWADLKL
jgi:hypothetical protein